MLHCLYLLVIYFAPMVSLPLFQCGGREGVAVRPVGARRGVPQAASSSGKILDKYVLYAQEVVTHFL